MARLERWCFMRVCGFYTAPELKRWALHGEIYDRPGFIEGHHVITSPVVKIDVGLETATTRTGTVYALGEPDSEYVKSLEANGKTLNQVMEDMVKIAEFQKDNV